METDDFDFPPDWGAMVATLAPRSFNRFLGNCPALDGNGYATNTKSSPVRIVELKRTAQLASAVIRLAAIGRPLIMIRAKTPKWTAREQTVAMVIRPAQSARLSPLPRPVRGAIRVTARPKLRFKRSSLMGKVDMSLSVADRLSAWQIGIETRTTT
jgi:hypothetical protein